MNRLFGIGAAWALAACGSAEPSRGAPPEAPSQVESMQWSRWFGRVTELDRQLERLARDKAVTSRRLAGDELVSARLAYLAARDRAVREALREVASEGDVRAPEEPLLHALNELSRRGLEVEAENTAELRVLLEEHGWFEISRFGAQADADAGRLVLHAEREPELQRAVLARLESLVGSGETRADHVAFLSDHLAVAAGRPQRFGTRGRCTGAGKWEPFPIENSAGLSARRAAYGLPPLEQAVAEASKSCP